MFATKEKLMSSQLQLCNNKKIDASIAVCPSDRIYYNEYPYRVDIYRPAHPNPKHDPFDNYYITDIMRSSNMFWKRERSTHNKRSIYLGSYDDVVWLCAWGKEQVSRVVGPISKKHLALLHDDNYILRQSLFHGKFDGRVEFNMYTLTGTIGPRLDVRRQLIKDLKEFVDTNFANHRWGNRSYSWFCNYLYCDFDEYTELEGYIKILFGQAIADTRKVALMSQL